MLSSQAGSWQEGWWWQESNYRQGDSRTGDENTISYLIDVIEDGNTVFSIEAIRLGTSETLEEDGYLDLDVLISTFGDHGKTPLFTLSLEPLGQLTDLQKRRQGRTS